VELESLRSELDTLTELSGELVGLGSDRQQSSKLDQVISDLTTEWQLTTDQCNASLQQIDNALQQSAVFNHQLEVCSQTEHVPEKYLGAVPTYYAAVLIDLATLTLIQTFDLLS